MRKAIMLIDGANNHAACKALNFELDWQKVLKKFRAEDDLIRAYYFTAILEEQEYISLRPLIDWLEYNGFTVISKIAKEFRSETGVKKIKGNMDIEFTVTALRMAARVDKIILFTGDGDFRALIEALQDMGVFVEVVSTNKTKPSMCADELRRQADKFTDLETMRELGGMGRR